MLTLNLTTQTLFQACNYVVLISKHWFRWWCFFIYVPRLYTLGGRPVCGTTELENNRHYVAVGSEKFKALPYDQCVPRDLIRENNTVEGYEIYDSRWIYFLFTQITQSYLCHLFVFLFVTAGKTSCLLLEWQDKQRMWWVTIASEFFLNSLKFILVTPS